MATGDNYAEIERPYDTYLQRTEVSTDTSYLDSDGNSDTPASSKSTSSGNSSTNNSGATEVLDGSIDNGTVETQPVKSDGGMADLWITNLIRSTNWKPKSVGFYIDGTSGYAEFTDIYISGDGYFKGDITGATGHFSGTVDVGSINIPNQTSVNSFHTDSSGNSWWGANIATGYVGAPASILNTGAATFTSINITGGNIAGTTTVGTGSTTADTIGTAITTAGHFADNAIDTANKNILSGFTFGASGAIQIGTYVNGVSGDIKISPSGILGRGTTGATTFSIDGTTGIAYVGGLVVGTNVGLGTAQDSSGVTTIIGNTVTTGYINARGINAENIIAGTITGSTLRTATTGIRVDISSAITGQVVFYDSSNNLTGSIFGGNNSVIIRGYSSIGFAIGSSGYGTAVGSWDSTGMIITGTFQASRFYGTYLGSDGSPFEELYTNTIKLNGLFISSWSDVGSYLSFASQSWVSTYYAPLSGATFSGAVSVGANNFRCGGYLYLNSANNNCYVYSTGSAVQFVSGGSQVGLMQSTGLSIYSSLIISGNQLVSTRKASVAAPSQTLASLQTCCNALINRLQDHGLTS